MGIPKIASGYKTVGPEEKIRESARRHGVLYTRKGKYHIMLIELENR